MRQMVMLFCTLACVFPTHAQHKIHLRNNSHPHPTLEQRWKQTYSLVNAADSVYIQLVAPSLNDGMIPAYPNPARYYFKFDAASDGHYEIYVNDSLESAFNVYDHKMSGKAYLGKNYLAPYYIDFPEGRQEITFSENGTLYQFAWSQNGCSPIFTEYDEHGRLHRHYFRTRRWQLAEIKFDSLGKLLHDCSFSKEICKPVADLQGTTPDSTLAMAIEQGDILEGWQQWLINDSDTDQSRRQATHAIRILFHHSEIAAWYYYERSGSDWREVARYRFVYRRDLSYDWCQHYLETIRLKKR